MDVPPAKEVRYIVKGYAVEQGDREITDDEVIRSTNGRYYPHEETGNFPLKSNVREPTYGNCSNCMRSGGLGLPCVVCRGFSYSLFMAGENGCLMDAEFVASVCGRRNDHQVVKANRVAWIRGRGPSTVHVTWNYPIRRHHQDWVGRDQPVYAGGVRNVQEYLDEQDRFKDRMRARAEAMELTIYQACPGCDPEARRSFLEYMAERHGGDYKAVILQNYAAACEHDDERVHE